MPCEDCQELYREMRRLRVIVEQNFLAMLKRLDYQDRNMVFMMELLSEGSNWESTPPYYNEDTGHFSSGMNETYYTAKGPSVRKKPRSLWTNARAACNSYPERQPWQSANNSSSARGLDREDMGREDVVADVDFGSGNRGANEPATSDARVIQNEQSAVLDCMAMESTPSMARGTYNEDGTLEGHLPNDLRRIANFVQDHEYGATAEMPLRSDGDGTVGQECRMETETNEGALGNTDNGSTSGTACVTVRSAIRMEDLDRDAGAASFSGAATATATGDGGGAVDAATGKQATRVQLLQEGQRFETMEEFLECLRRYQEATGIALIVADSKKVETANRRLKSGAQAWDTKFKYVYLELRCSRAGVGGQCPFRLLVINSKPERRLVVTKLVESHNQLCFTRNHDDASQIRLLKRLL